MTTSSSRTLLALAVALAIAGCASKVDLNEAPVESRSGNPATASGTAGSGTTAGANPSATSGVARVDAASAAAAVAAAAGRTIYFDYDSFVLKDQFKPVVDAHAKTLTTNRNKKLVVEGHTDERGGREYNLALGQKRAEAVVRSLTLLGVSEQQLEAVSFGEERPLQQGTNEAAWTRNRRAELKDR